MKSVEDLDVFKLAHQLALKTYSRTRDLSKRGDRLERIKYKGYGIKPVNDGKQRSKTQDGGIRAGVVRLFVQLPKRTEVQILGRQLFWSGRRSERNTARRREVNRPRTSSARSRVSAGTARK